jgi:queuine tRNA-ribosyltransferase
MPGTFTIHSRCPHTAARQATLQTAHGPIETPVFMPVGTRGTVKSVHPAELTSPPLDARVILGNTYHLALRPGAGLIAQLGGLHGFAAWDRAILTDSGGFQVFSLAKLRKISEDGVSFSNHIDGATMHLGPESSLEIQAQLGSDIAMAFDECPPYPCPRPEAELSLARTTRWAARCKAWQEANQPQASGGAGRQLLFGIAQGSSYADLRELAARSLVDLGFDGYAIGGVSVGEPEEEMLKAVEHTVPFLPDHRPRYAMGLGTPPQLLAMVARGVDMFDCVLPTRVARNGAAFTNDGLINLRNARFADDPAPLAPHTHPLVAPFSRAYLRHLITSGEILGLRLVTLHNLHFYLSLMAQARHAIAHGTFPELQREFTARYLASTKK